jgi:hypothetical protein
MKIPLDSAIQLLHQAPYGTLATHSTQIPGYPFASVLPFVPDERHCPLFLVSTLAEHTKNLLADPRASLLLVQPDGDNVQTGARLTLIGDVLPQPPRDALVERYLRYQPDAEEYLALGDFNFFRLQPKRLRLIAGFGKMGWIESDAWELAEALSYEQERQLLATLGSHEPIKLLGIDCYGVDVQRNGHQQRLAFAASTPAAQLEQAARAALAAARPA